jgi:hypothetical protein
MPDAVTVRPRVLAAGMARSALGDPKFFEQVPEFKALQAKLGPAQRRLRARGCGGCRQRRIINNIFRDFVHATLALDADGRGRMRAYFGGAPLLISVQNRVTKRPETVTI